MKSSIITKKYSKDGKLLTGFTLIELIVVIGIIAVLSGIILFSVTQYINKGKDSNIAGNLAVLVPAGETYYNINDNSYVGFCSSLVVQNTFSQMPFPVPVNDCASDANHPGLCCSDASPGGNVWAACAQEFTYSVNAYCIDSRGVKKEICNTSCTSNITACPINDSFPNCPS